MQAEPDRGIEVRGAVQLDHFRADLVKRPLAGISTEHLLAFTSVERCGEWRSRSAEISFETSYLSKCSSE